MHEVYLFPTTAVRVEPAPKKQVATTFLWRLAPCYDVTIVVFWYIAEIPDSVLRVKSCEVYPSARKTTTLGEDACRVRHSSTQQDKDQ